MVLDILRAAGNLEPVGFIDADTTLTGTCIGGLPVFGTVNVLAKFRQQKWGHAIVAIGDNRTRLQYATMLGEQGFELVNAIHPRATIADTAVLGRNVVVAAQAAVCTEARLGDCVIINTAAVVDHECEVADAVHVCPGAHLAGRVRVGTGAFIGLGANVIQCTVVGDYAVVGAGAAVIRDVPAYAKVVGIPARIVKTASPAERKPAR